MSRIGRLGMLLAVLAAALLVDAARVGGAARGDRPGQSSEPLAAEVERGNPTGVALSDEGALVLVAETAAWSEEPYARAGAFVGPVRELAEPATGFRAGWEGDAPPGAAVRLEARGWADGAALPWEEIAAGDRIIPLRRPATALQYRLTLLAMPGAAGPVVRAVTLRPSAAPVDAPLAAASAAVAEPSRVYATRIGLVGRQTANGTIIAPEDRFVALPSRRVLSARGGRDYEVRVEYKGRSLTLPVWDIGPWNVRDNYWESSARRDMWNDLPPGRPQSVAAYYDAYHGGRDGFGRRILSPAAIDISDGAFYELGMTQGDWVMVTFLWQSDRR
jgi:hypothetical protein